MDRIKTFINNIEHSHIGFALWFSTAIAIICIRDFSESIVDFGTFGDIDLFHYIHTPVFYLSLLLAITILLHVFSKIEIIQVSRITLFFLVVIILPVFFDLCLFLISGQDANYLYIAKNLKANLLNFFNPFFSIEGITYGMRLEILIISALSFLYIFVKRKRMFFSIRGAFTILGACLFYISIPAILSWLLKIIPFVFGPEEVTEVNIGIVELVTTVLLSAIWYWRYDRKKCSSIFRNLRFSRSMHYILLGVLGVAFNYYLAGSSEYFSVIRLVSLLFAIFFAFQFSVVINDIYDIHGDRVSNQDRPLAADILLKEEYLKVGIVYFIFAALFAININVVSLRIILVYIALYFIYSVPPLRLKKFFILSSVIIAAQAVLSFALGYLLFENNPVF